MAVRRIGRVAVRLPCLADPLSRCQIPQDEVIGQQVKASFLAGDRAYGARRVWHDLLAEGMSCGLHKVERLMRLQALRARPRRRRLPRDIGDRQIASVPSNLLDRQFEAERPNQRWIADFTYIWTAEGCLYVAAVIDLFSRREIGWSMAATMTAQLVTDALIMAIWRRGKPYALLHHDQGSQYTSEPFQRLMADSGIVCSMSRAGNVWDKAAMESFFSSLKSERTARKTYRTRNEARADVFDYIETGGSSVGLVARPIASPAFRTMTRNHGSEPRVGLVEGTFHGQQQVSP